MAYTLTKAERATLDKAEAILCRMFPGRAGTLMIDAGWGREMGVTYFTPNNVQHSGIYVEDGDNSFAGKIQRALDLRAAEEADADNVKAARIERLRAELATLTGEAA